MYIKIVFIKTRCSINKILISVRIKSITMIKFMLKIDIKDCHLLI